jgi:hypothetical protein
MSWDQNAKQRHNIKTDDKSFERVHIFGNNPCKIKIPFKKKLRADLSQGMPSVIHWRMSSSLISKNIEIKIYRTISLPVVLYGCETWFLTMREECMLRVFENRVLQKILDLRATRWQESGENYILRNLLIFSPHQIFGWSSEEWDGWVYNTYGGEERCIQGFGEETEGKRPLERLRCRWEDNIKVDLQEVEFGAVDWIELAQDRDRWWARVHVVLNLQVP